jgi:antigen flippase
MASIVPEVTAASSRVAPASWQPAPPSATGRPTYGQILRSSLLVGASSGFNIAVGILRTKVMALFLGPAGFGLMGLYSSILTLAQAIVGMGINQSGVRQIAEASGSGDIARVALTATVLRRTSVLLGLVGAALLLAFCGPVSTLTFGDNDHAYLVALLAVPVFLQTISNGQAALLQGLRRIAAVAKSGALGALLGSVATILLVYLLREQGILPSLIATASVSLMLSWCFSRQVILDTQAPSPSQIVNEARGLLTLGLAFMATGIIMMGVAYTIRLIIVRHISVEAAGLYQSAWTIGGIYVGFILQAMGTDFYPRLAAIATDHRECNRIVNEQTHVGLLLGGPGIIATVTFAPFVISLLYSSAFVDAVAVLRWICLGAALQVITWPMGFIIVAKGTRAVFFWTEFAYACVYLGMAWILIQQRGINGAGIAFFASYVFHGLIVYSIVRRLTGFRWSSATRRAGLLFLLLITLAFSSVHLLPLWMATTIGSLAFIFSAAHSTRALAKVAHLNHVPRLIRQFMILTRR